MPDIVVRAATQEDVDYVADHLRAADAHELRRAKHDDPAETVKMSFGYSEWTKCALVDGLPTILYGVSPTGMPGWGTPWMLATEDIVKIKREFLIGSKNEIVDMARLLVDEDWERTGFLAQLPDPERWHSVLAIVSRAQLEGWRARVYIWPDFTTGWFGYDPTDEQLIEAYADWRKSLELEISVPWGRA